MSHTQSFGRARALITALTALLVLAGSLFGATAAQAAPPTVTYPDAIDNVAIVHTDRTSDTQLSQWQMAHITGTWSVPNTAVAGETFGMTLPSIFSQYKDGNFDIKADGTEVVLAKCTVSDETAPQLICTLEATVEDLEEVGGSWWMQVQVDESTDAAAVNFEIGSEFVPANLPGPNGGIIPENLTASTIPYKYSDATATEGVISWTIGIPAGYVVDGGFTVEDELIESVAPLREAHTYTGTYTLSSRPVVNGQLSGDWTTVDPSHYVITNPTTKTFNFVASGLPAGDFAYILSYTTKVDGAVIQDGDVYANKAMVGNETAQATHTVQSAGGGSGNGVQYTRFTITKALTGDQAALAADATFTVEYSVKDSTEAAKTLTFPANTPTNSERVPLGSTFIIKEINLPTIPGVQWGDWTLTGTGVTALDDGTYEVTPGEAGVALSLENVANAVAGNIAWAKVDPSGAALAGSEWTLTGSGDPIMVVDNGTNDADPADGAFLVEGLAWGDYVLAETKAPTGYELSTTTHDATIGASTLEVDLGDIENAPTPGSLAWVKVDPDGASLAGSEWTLTGSGDPIVVVDNGTNDADPADGDFLVEGLAWGDYVLTETKAPTGYDLSTATHDVTINATDLEINLGEIENAPTAGSIVWTKVDPSGTALAGSEWLLDGPGDDIIVVDNGRNDVDPAEGSLRVEGLVWGDYVLSETKAPTGYDLSKETYSATIGADMLAIDFGAVENTKTVVPPKPETPQKPELATTGGEFNPLLGIAGIVLVAGGLLALGLRRRHNA